MDLSDEETKSFVKSVLTDAVVALCKNTLLFNALTIDGLVGITTDNSHFMLHIHHIQQKKISEVEACENSSVDSSSETPTKAKKRKKGQSSETPEQVKTKTEQQSDSEDDVQFIEDYEDLNIKQEPTHNENSSSAGNACSGSTYPSEAYTNINSIAASVSATYDSSHSSLPVLYTTEQNLSSNNSSFSTLPKMQSTLNIPIENFTHSINPDESVNLQCPVCQKQLGSTSALSRHLKGHTSNAVSSCPVCSRAFSRKDNLKRHIDKKHKDYIGESTAGQPQTWQDMAYNVTSADTIGGRGGEGEGQLSLSLPQTSQQ